MLASPVLPQQFMMISHEYGYSTIAIFTSPRWIVQPKEAPTDSLR